MSLHQPMNMPNANRSRVAVAQPNTTSWWWLGLILCAMAYGSLIPFDLDVRSIGWPTLSLWHSIGFQHSTAEDFLSNIVFYIPFGFVVAAHFGRRSVSFGVRVVLTALAAVLLSVCMESLQAAAQSRTASWIDVYSNAWGAILGAVLTCQAAQFVFHRPIKWLGNAKYMTLATLGSVFTLAVLIYNLIPLDFVRGLPGLEANFRSAKWSLLTSRPVPLDMPPYAALARELTGASWFAMLGFIHARLAMQKYKSWMDMFLSAVKHTVILVCLVEFLQLFFQSHVFDFATIVLRVLAAIMGAWMAIFVVTQSPRKLWKSNRTLFGVLLGCGVIFQIIMLTARHYDPRFGWADVSLTASIHWLPFYALWHLPVLLALAKIASVLVIYGSLGVSLYVLSSCFNMTKPRWLLCAFFVATLATLMEALDFLRPTGHADVTTPLLAVLSVGLAAKVWLFMKPKFSNQQSTTNPAV